MQPSAAMLDSSPGLSGSTIDRLAECIGACFECVQVCTACADACLHEEAVSDLRRCIALDLACAQVCAATGAVVAGAARDESFSVISLQHAERPVPAAPKSARDMAVIMSIAELVPKLATGAKPPALHCWTELTSDAWTGRPMFT